MPTSITRWLYIALFVVGAVAIVYALGSGAMGPQQGSRLERFAAGDLARLDLSRAGDMAPDAVFTGPDGQEMTLADYRGKTILVNFWATWCAPCEREMPHLGALQTARGGQDFAVVAISVDDLDDRAYARERLRELTGFDMAFHNAPPEAWQIVYEAGAAGFPTTILYGPDGAEIARLSGEANWSEGIALALVDEVLAR